MSEDCLDETQAHINYDNLQKLTNEHRFLRNNLTWVHLSSKTILKNVKIIYSHNLARQNGDQQINGVVLCRSHFKQHLS